MNSLPAAFLPQIGRTFASLLAACLLASFILAVPYAAQAGPPQNAQVTLVGVRFTGLDYFTEIQARSLTGLAPGSAITSADLKTAADRLAQSGAFERVSYAYRMNPNGMSVEFQVTETKQLAPCIFENFVWFSDAELQQALQRSVPLYGDKVPEAGPTMDQIATTLRALLMSKSIQADVARFPLLFQGVFQGMSFRVMGPALTVQSVSFPGASSISEKELQKAARELLGQNYILSDVKVFTAKTIVPLYQRRGYLAVLSGEIQASPLEPANPAAIKIALSIPVVEGPQYSWNKAEWTGNQLFSSDELNKLLGMTPKEIANADKIEAGLHEIPHQYSVRGYIDAAFDPKQTLDDTNHSVAYQVSIKEGVQYHMGRLQILGVPDSVAKRLTEKWTLKPGDVYDGDYLEQYKSKVQIPRPAGSNQATVAVHLNRDPQTATVDVIITIH